MPKGCDIDSFLNKKNASSKKRGKFDLIAEGQRLLKNEPHRIDGATGPTKRDVFDDMISPRPAVAESAVVNPAVAESAVVNSAVAESAVVNSAVAESAVVNSAVAESAVVNPAVAESAHCQYMRLFRHLYKQSLNTNEFRFLLLMLSKGALNRIGVEASNIDIAAETGIDISRVPSLTSGMVAKKIILKEQNTKTKKNIYFITENFFPAF
jgi:hypothetical protein